MKTRAYVAAALMVCSTAALSQTSTGTTPMEEALTRSESPKRTQEAVNNITDRLDREQQQRELRNRQPEAKPTEAKPADTKPAEAKPKAEPKAAPRQTDGAKGGAKDGGGALDRMREGREASHTPRDTSIIA